MSKKNEVHEKMKRNVKKGDIAEIDKKLPELKEKASLSEIWNQVEALWAMVKDPKAAWTSKAMAISALIYLISPVDAIPDPTPILGYSDDFAVIVATVTALGSQLRVYLIEKETKKFDFELKKIEMVENTKTKYFIFLAISLIMMVSIFCFTIFKIVK